MLLFNVSKAGKLVPSYRDDAKSVFAARIASVCVGLVITAALLGGCASHSAADRKATLEKFCASVTQHIFDRNPQTISESLNTLLHEELSDPARQKLEDTHVIPDSPITVLKDKADWTAANKSNRVDVGIVRALTPIEQKDVTFRISGKDWDLVNGKQTDFHAFQFDMVVELTPDMDGMARVLDVQGLGATAAGTPKNGDSSAAKAPAGKRKRRH
jgi:hypothetical protein